MRICVPCFFKFRGCRCASMERAHFHTGAQTVTGAQTAQSSTHRLSLNHTASFETGISHLAYRQGCGIHHRIKSNYEETIVCKCVDWINQRLETFWWVQKPLTVKYRGKYRIKIIRVRHLMLVIRQVRKTSICLPAWWTALNLHVFLIWCVTEKICDS